MTISAHVEEFAGLPVFQWEPDTGAIEPKSYAYRILLDYEEAEDADSWTKKFQTFLGSPRASEVTHLIVGYWGVDTMEADSAENMAAALVAAQERLPHLEALFVGDITFEEHEISWITQTDLSPVLAAYPNLRHFRSRGGNELRFSNLRHEKLQSLIIESGGLGATTVRDITAAHLPALEHMEVWLGTDDYGGNAEIVDLAPILSGKLFPKLTYLGLRDSEKADAVAQAVAHAPVMEQLRVLDLSLGALTDAGAAAFLVSPHTRKLQKLDIHHHYCTPQILAKLSELGIEIDDSDVQQPDEYDGESYFNVSVSE